MKYNYEQIERKPEKDYKPNRIIKKDCIAQWKEKEYNPIKTVEKSSLQAPQKVFDKKHTFEWEIFQLADYEFVNWANSIPDSMLMAVMAEIKQAPKMKPSIELLRQKVKDVPLCSIEEYSRKKRLGERSVAFLKQLKARYGESVLRVLYLTSDS